MILNSSGYFYDQDRKVITFNKSIDILLETDSFVIKPILGGSSGHGVKIYNISEITKEELINILNRYKKNYIIQEKILPNKMFSKLYPYSINTIRLITYIKEDKICIAPLSLRLGSNKNFVDNIHSGGIVVGVTDDGLLNKYGYKLGYLNSKERFSKHPDTNIEFYKYRLPKIQEMRLLAIELHKRTPHLGIVSWDMTVDNNDRIILIEGNYIGQSIWFPQIVHGKSIFTDNTTYFINLIRKSKGK